MDTCRYQCANCFPAVLLRHDEPHLFAKSQWGNRHGYFIAYRVLIAAHFLFWYVYLWVKQHIGDFIHLTEWTITVLTSYYVITAVGVIFYRCKPRERGDFSAIITRDDDLPHIPPRTPTSSTEWFADPSTQDSSLPFYFKISWFLRNICLGACPLVTVTYWTFLYLPGEVTGIYLWLNINSHLLNTVSLMLDVCVCAYPIRPAHMIYPVLYGFLYVLFSLLYCYFGGAEIVDDCDIYSVLNWNQDEIYQTLGYIGLVIVFAILGYGMYYSIYRIRMKIYYRYCNTDSQNDLPVNYANDERFITYT